MTESTPFQKQLDAIVEMNQQPTLYELYSPTTHDVQSLFEVGNILASQKTIIVYDTSQYFGNSHSTLVINQIINMTPSAYMQRIESFSLNGCGFISHELFTDGHVCKHPDRINNLDCAHSIARKMLESAMALVANRQGNRGEISIQDEKEFVTFVENDHGIARLDRALGEVARGPIREDTISTLAGETRLPQISEHTNYQDLMAMLPSLSAELIGKQAEYGEALLRLARRVAPELFHVLRRQLIDWKKVENHSKCMPLTPANLL